jgi:pSer/pThr/pTyr-binding forkhead associated (FHA) protein
VSPKISREHAVISFEDGRWFVEDRGSYNGTYLNGNRLPASARHPLHHADRLGKQNLTIDELQARVEALVDRLRLVLQNELVPAGKAGEDHGADTNAGTTTAEPPPPQPPPVTQTTTPPEETSAESTTTEETTTTGLETATGG